MKIIIQLILIVLLLAAGCNRYIDSDNFTALPPTQPPVPTALGLIHLADGLALSWKISDTDAIDYYKIYIAESINGVYRLTDSTAGFIDTVSALTIGQVEYFKVSAVDHHGLEGLMSSAVSSAVGALSMMINNDAKYIRSLTATVSFVVPVAASLVQMWEDSSFSGARWENFSYSMSRTLPTGDGVKKIYARFQFSDGSESVGSISDSIILDTKAIIDTIYFTAGSANLTAGDIVTFYVSTGETGGQAEVSFSGVSDLTLYDDGSNGDLTTEDGLYTRRYIIPVDLEVADAVVTGQFTDAAGNNAEERAAPTLLNIANPPAAISLMAFAESSSSIRLTWSRSAESDFSSYHIYRHSNNTVSNSSYLVTIITSSATTTYTDDDLDADTPYFYRIYIYDNTGLSSGSNVAADTTNVNLPPEAVRIGVGVLDSASILTWTTNGDEDFESYMIYRGTTSGVSDATGRLLTIINSQGTTTYTDVRPDTSPYFYRVYVNDKQGLSNGSNEVSAP
jgi:fibronectin type 3 domain-containing protein